MRSRYSFAYCGNDLRSTIAPFCLSRSRTRSASQASDLRCFMIQRLALLLLTWKFWAPWMSTTVAMLLKVLVWVYDSNITCAGTIQGQRLVFMMFKLQKACLAADEQLRRIKMENTHKLKGKGLFRITCRKHSRTLSRSPDAVLWLHAFSPPSLAWPVSVYPRMSFSTISPAMSPCFIHSRVACQ
jgi:hypothetical protein